MKVIVIESDAYQEIMRRLDNIENHVLRSNDIYKQVNEGGIEMTSRELMETLKVSESTLYRWRQDRLIPFRYTDTGSIRFPFEAVYRAVYTGNVTVRSVEKEELLAGLTQFKDLLIKKSIAAKINQQL
ncbi:MAG: helix-turn-helix domain-containing protein [Bacteroidia bacterium]|nr:helix-turn-helix domain-containing protein [Bacteroidia bacterium]